MLLQIGGLWTIFRNDIHKWISLYPSNISCARKTFQGWLRPNVQTINNAEAHKFSSFYSTGFFLLEIWLQYTVFVQEKLSHQTVQQI